MAFIATFMKVALPIVVLWLGYGLYCGYQHRCKINELRKQGVPMPKWNWLTGHLSVFQEYIERLPPNANVQLAMRDMALEKWGDTEIFLLDTWPMLPAFYLVFDPQASYQASNKYNLPKPALHLKFMHPITGGPSLHGMNHGEWKYWRSVFNAGFSGASMARLLPTVVDSTQVFCDILEAKVGSKDPIQLSELTTRLTMEVILKVTLEMDSNNQRSEHPISTSLRNILAWHSFWDPRVLMNPLRPIIQRHHGNVINRYIRRELETRFTEMKHEQVQQKTSQRAKSVVALALEAYLETPRLDSNKGARDANKLDEYFAQYASQQIRLFLFAGSDTTSSTITYMYHLLSRHPEILKQVREEHDRVFGNDPSAAGNLLKSNDGMGLLNDCPLTLAVIKETLRIFPPASTSRDALEGTNETLTDRHGNLYPIDYVGVNILHPTCHSNPRVWPRVKEFLPERWLVGPEHELYPTPNAWRPFEQGPRNCIGQTLVYNEIRVLMVMSLRRLEICPAYEEWDALKLQNKGLFSKLMRSLGNAKPASNTVDGERAYQTEGASHPVDNYPCRINLL